MENIRKEIEKLRNQIERHDKLYYIESKPEITDREYDQLMKKLEKLEKEHPELITPDSPTQRVSGEPIKSFKSVKHLSTMLSMDNTYSADEIREFDKRIRKNLGVNQIEYVVELKIDGASVSLLYKKGKLMQGSTRGDGITGDDVTHNLKTIKSIPLSMHKTAGKLPSLMEVRGEVYMSHKTFEQLNKRAKEKGENLFANPRNATAGTLKLLDPKIVAKRHLDIFIFSIGHFEGIKLETQHETLEFLKKCGFKVSPHIKKFSDIKSVIEYCNKWEKKKTSLDYDIDGMVLKIDSFKDQKELGATTKAPRWMISYKFPAERKSTKLKNIIVQVGRTGTLTPVAVLKPLRVSGSTVSRSTLHNFDEIKRLDVKIGDTVLIEKSGEIIPKVVKVLKEKRTGKEKKFHMPTKCPVCGSKVINDPGEVALRCDNISCPAQLKESIKHFASRNAMDIEGMGVAIVEQLVDKKLIEDFGDIYYLKIDRIENLERLAHKSAENLITAIEKSKSNDLSRLIFALGIRHVGVHAAWILTQRFGSIDNIAKQAAEDLTKVREIGKVMAESIENFFKNKHNLKVLKKLKDAGVKMSHAKKYHGGSKLEGKTIVVTGTLTTYSRGEIESLIREQGGNPASSVSKNTDFVIAGDSPGSKLDKAKNLGVKVIDEKEFKKLI